MPGSALWAKALGQSVPDMLKGVKAGQCARGVVGESDKIWADSPLRFFQGHDKDRTLLCQDFG